MNQTANQTTYDLLGQLLNASATFTNRSSRQASSQLEPFAGIDLFDEAGQDLLDDLESNPSYSKMQRAILMAIPRNLRAVRSRGWRALLEDFSAFSYVTKSSIQTLQIIFNKVVDKVRNTVRFICNDFQCFGLLPRSSTVDPTTRPPTIVGQMRRI